MLRALSLGRRNPPFWWYPSLAFGVGLVSGAVLSLLGDGPSGGWATAFVYQGGAEAARSFVTLAATSVATITTLVLTLTVVSLQLASSQYSPRLIEHYLADRANHVVFSLFLGTFAVAIATLLNIRLPEPGSGTAGSVPGVAIAVLVVLLAACLIALVFFVHRVTTSMRVESILRRVRDRTIEAVQERPSGSAEDDPEEIPAPPDGAALIRSRRSGYYASFDREAIGDFAPDRPCRVWVVVCPGEFVIEGAPIAFVDGAADDLADVVEPWLRFDAERWVESDFSYGIRNLVDVALKALSPGINDPTTATMAIERIGESLAVAGRRHPERVIRSDTGVEVYVAIREWSDVLHQAVRQIVEYGQRDVAVVIALVRLLIGLAWSTPEGDVDRRPAIGALAVELRRWVDAERPASDEVAIAEAFDRLELALGHDPSGDRAVGARRRPL